MQSQELINRLGERVEDPDNVSFDDTLKINVLNIALDQMISLLDKTYFPALEGEVTNQSLSSGALAYSSLTNFTGDSQDIRKVQIYNGDWCEIIDFEKEIDDLNNAYTAPSSAYPKAYLRESKIVISGTTSNINVYYYKTATALANDSTAYPHPLFTENILLDLAEAELWKQDNKLDRSNVAYSRAIDQINVANQRVQ